MQHKAMIAVVAMSFLPACTETKTANKDSGAAVDGRPILPWPDTAFPADNSPAGADAPATAAETQADAPATAVDLARVDLASTPSANDVGPPDGAVLWPGLDAEIVLGPPPVELDGGLYPPVFAVPAAAIVSHSPLLPSTPDLVARIEQAGTPFFLDLDGDGLRDLALLDSPRRVGFYLQQSTGSFRAVHGIDVGTGYRIDMLRFGDLNADGLTDVAAVGYPDEGGWYHPELLVYLQTSDGFRDTPDVRVPVLASGSVVCVQTYAASVDDMNGDGRADIIVLSAVDDNSTYKCSFSRGIAQVFTQASDGSFSVTAELSPRSSDATCRICAAAFTTGDFNNDGQKDLVVLEDAAGNGSGIPLHGHEVLLYPQAAGKFGDTPAQVLKLNQYLRTVELADLDRDGKLDVLVRPGDWGKYEPVIDLSGSVPGLSGAFLQNNDGSFGAAKALVLDDPPADAMAASARAPISGTWMPAGTSTKSDPLGIAVRDIDGDGVRDLIVERKGVAEGLFRQELGLFPTTPSFEVSSLFPTLLAAAKQSTLITFQPTATSTIITSCPNLLSYGTWDMNGDSRDDVVVAYSPCAPNLPPDPVTGFYPRDGFAPNTYTEVQAYRQRPPARRFAAVVQESQVTTADRLLRIRATIRNLSDQPASNVHLRIQAAESPVLFTYTLSMLATMFDEIAANARAWIVKNETQVGGSPLGPDIIIPQIGPGETIPLSVSIPVALVADLRTYALFVLVDPDENTNLLYRRSFEFIAPK